jgi:hypothetical protein
MSVGAKEVQNTLGEQSSDILENSSDTQTAQRQKEKTLLGGRNSAPK